ncbi:hypothetical protein [Streptomyces sp. JJ38]|uniref:hypothetical protein n=1 Tax=Streptomyces sp. JJ38 TaxID=2738128 RepID=UPI001C56753C|nr:hypothetical protein [Streptomyces sp. JJ38]MBW1597256.1 hypothetical protein [Streptomyces sp. JJ38]
MTAPGNAPTPTRDEASRTHLRVHEEFLTANPQALQTAPGSQADVWCHEFLPQEVWRESAAVHEATHAVLTRLVGMTPTRVALARSRDEVAGGTYSSTGTADAQQFVVVCVGAGPFPAARLQKAGYSHPELEKCIRQFCASGDLANAQSYVTSGYVADIDQAIRDSIRLLADPSAERAVDALTRALLAAESLGEGEIAAILDPHSLTHDRAGVWVPRRRLPIVAAISPSRAL